MNIFCTKAWSDIIAGNNSFIKTVCIDFDGSDIYFSEWSFWGFKKWILYGEIGKNEDKLLDRVLQSALKKGIFAIESNFNMSRWQNRDYLEKKGKITREFGTYIVDLLDVEDILWGKVHSKHRNVIRRALKEGVEIKYQLNLYDFIKLMEYTYAKGEQNNPYNLNYLQSITEKLPDNLISAGAYYKGKLQSGILVPYDEHRGYYLHGATADDAVLGSSNLLQWEIIKMLKNIGAKEYDFGGARKESADPRLNGIFKFKERFGGRFVDCYFWEIVLQPTKYKFINMLKRIKMGIRNVCLYNH